MSEGWDLNCGSRVSEGTTLPVEPEPFPPLNSNLNRGMSKLSLIQPMSAIWQKTFNTENVMECDLHCRKSLNARNIFATNERVYSVSHGTD